MRLRPSLIAAVAFASNSMVFHLFCKHFASHRGVLPATASIADCWGAFASKSMLFHWFYNHFGSHWMCCLRLRPSLIVRVRLLQNHLAFPLVLQPFRLSLGVLAATASNADCWAAFDSNSMFFHSFCKHFDSHWGCCLRLRPLLVAGVIF